MAKGEFCCSENVIHEGAVAEVREKMHSGEALDTVAGFFKVLGDGTRMRMISALAVRELCVCDLAELLEMGQSAVSHQLRLLRQARLVRCRREGKSSVYALDDDHVEKIFRLGLSHIEEQNRNGG